MKPQFIKGTAGKQLVILSKKEYDTIIEELDKAEDIRLYNEAKKNDNGKRILFSDYLKKRNRK